MRFGLCPVSRERWRELFQAKWGEPAVTSEVEPEHWGFYAERDGLSVGVYNRGTGTILEVAATTSWERFFADFVEELDPEARPDPRCDQAVQSEVGAVPCWRVIPGSPDAFARLTRVGDAIELELTEAQADRLEAAAARLIGPRRVGTGQDGSYFDRRGLLWEISRAPGLRSKALISRRDPLESLVVLDELERALGLEIERSSYDPELLHSSMSIPRSRATRCTITWQAGNTPKNELQCSGGAFDHSTFKTVDFALRSGPRASYELSVDVGSSLYQVAPGEALQRLKARAQALYGVPRATETGWEFTVRDRPETLRIDYDKGRTTVTWAVAASSSADVPR